MAIRRLAFDGAVLADAGIAFGGGTAFAVADGAGAARASGQPVFDATRVIFSPPTPLVLDDDAAKSKQPLAAGKWLDGVTECAVGLDSAPGTSVNIDIRVGATELAMSSNGWKNTAPVRRRDIACRSGDSLNPGWKGTTSGNRRRDLLRGSGASAGESNDYRLAPGPANSGGAMFVCDGLVAGMCAIYDGSGSSPADGTNNRVGFFWWDEVNSRWTCPSTHQGTTVQGGRNRGETWCMSEPYLFANRLVSVWTFVDYRSNTGSDGGELYCVVATREAVGSAWTVLALQRVTSITGRTNEHWHSCVCWVDETTGRLYILISVGDELTKQRLMLVTRANYATYTEGAVTHDITQPTTGNGWTLYPTVNGDPNASPAVPSAQVFGFLRTSDPFSYIATSDETGTHVARVTVSQITEVAPTPVVTITGVAQSLPPTADNKGWNCFRSHREQGGSAMVIPTGTDTGWSASDDTAVELSYSDDGEYWSALYSHMQDANKQSRAIVSGSHVIVADNSMPLIAIPKPRKIQGRPLMVAGGLTNYIRSDAIVAHVANSYLDSGNTATVSPNLASLFPSLSIPLPPSNGPMSYHKFAATTGFRLCGLMRLCSGTVIPTNAGKIRVHGWILQLPNDAGIGASAGSLDLRGIDFATVGGALRQGNLVPAVQLPTGNLRWVPFTVDLGDPASEWSGGALPNPFELSVLVHKNTSGFVRQEFLFVWDSITLGASHVPLTAPPRGNGVASAAYDGAITLDPLGPAWTMYVAAQMPRSGWDQHYTGSPSSQVLFTLRQSATRYLTVARSGSALVFTLTNGASTATATLSAPSSPISYTFGFNRNAPIHIGMSFDGSTLRVAASVKNTPVATGTASLTVDFRPTRVVFGDQNAANVQPMTYHRFTVDDAAAASTSAMAAAMVDASIYLGRPSPPRVLTGSGLGL